MKADGIFIKLMMLTTSSNDNEALIALRKANKILFDAKVNWEELLCAIQQSNEFRVPPSKRQHRPRPEPEWENVGGIKHTDADEINALFTEVFDKNLTEGFESFVTSVHLWWERRGFLTEKQYQAIKRAAEREDIKDA